MRSGPIYHEILKSNQGDFSGGFFAVKYQHFQCEQANCHYFNFGWLGRAIVLGSFQCWGVLLLWHMIGKGLAVLATGAGWVGYFFFFSSRLSYLPFLMPHLLGDGWTF